MRRPEQSRSAKAIRQEIRNAEAGLGKLREVHPSRFNRSRYQALHGKKTRLYKELRELNAKERKKQ